MPLFLVFRKWGHFHAGKTGTQGHLSRRIRKPHDDSRIEDVGRVLDWHCRYGGDGRLRWSCVRTSACFDASSNLHAVPDADIRADRDGIPDLHASTYAGAVADLHAVPNQHSLSDSHGGSDGDRAARSDSDAHTDSHYASQGHPHAGPDRPRQDTGRIGMFRLQVGGPPCNRR